jgi:hypothetical protein
MFGAMNVNPAMVMLAVFCVWHVNATGLPGVVDGFGVAVKLTMIGFGIGVTVTVAVAVTLPAALVAVNV